MLTKFGNVGVLALIVLATGALLFTIRKGAAIALAPMLSLGLAATTASVVRRLVDRVGPGVGSRARDSFPSGHATDSSAVFVTIALIITYFWARRLSARIATATVAGLLIGLVGLSRLVLGVHWLTDVGAGWALGTAIGVWVVVPRKLGGVPE